MAQQVTGPATLIAAGTYSSSNGTITGSPVIFNGTPWFSQAIVNVLNAPSSGSNTVDVYLQTSLNYIITGPSSSGGTAVWDDFMHFAQVTGGAGTRSQIGTWTANVAPSSSLNMHAPATATLAAGQVINGATGVAWRAQAVVGGTSPAVASSSAWQFEVRAQVYY